MYCVQHCFVCRPSDTHCVGGWWDQTQDCCELRRSNYSARSHPQRQTINQYGKLYDTCKLQVVQPPVPPLALPKMYSWKRNFESKTSYNLTTVSLGLHKGRPSYRRSLQPSKENIQHFKTWNFLIFFYFCGSFLPSWTRILNPDPHQVKPASVHQ